MVEGKEITVGTRQPHVSYSVKTVSRTLQEQKSSFQTLSTATLQLPFQLQEQPFWLTHQLEWKGQHFSASNKSPRFLTPVFYHEEVQWVRSARQPTFR